MSRVCRGTTLKISIDSTMIMMKTDEDEESSPRKSETSFNLSVNILEKRASSEMIQCAPKTGTPVPVTSSDEEENASLGFTELYWALLGALIGFIAFSH